MTRILTVAMALLVSIGNQGVVGASTLKTKTLTFSESVNRTQTQTITIPNLKSAKVKSISTGVADLTVEGDKITVTAKNGQYTRREQTGGEYIPADTKEIRELFGTNPKWVEYKYQFSEMSYNQNKYEGTLYPSDSTLKYEVNEVDGKTMYRGTVVYSGNVTRPESDTRTYQNHYSYTVEIEYMDNTAPTIILEGGNLDQTVGEGGNIRIRGTIIDPDTNNIKISATVGGVHKELTVTGPTTSKTWSLVWEGNELPEGTFNPITITADDYSGGTDIKTYSGKIIVDRTKPHIEVRINTK